MPLSPFLFICVLELMACEIRQDQRIQGITEPISGKSDKATYFADDSGGFAKTSEEVGILREDVSKFERATGAALHDLKTTNLKMGAMRTQELSKEDFGVEFEIMKDDAVERYLGDLIGNQVEEETRFKQGLVSMEQIGATWHKKRELGCYGRAIIANTLLLSQVRFRAQVNPVSDGTG